jgi:hypothetical protein
MLIYGVDFLGRFGAFSLATCLLAWRKTLGWNTRCAISSVVNSIARFFGADFFFSMVNL